MYDICIHTCKHLYAYIIYRYIKMQINIYKIKVISDIPFSIALIVFAAMISLLLL